MTTSRSRRARLLQRVRRANRRRWVPHAVALAAYTLLAIAVTWPLARDFDSKIVGSTRARQDELHSVWMLWHVGEWFHGREPLFSTHLLFHPKGISMLTDGVGVINGFFALPFWHWGPEAAYNGTILVGVALSGYCMFLLARELRFSLPVSLFGGAVLLISAEHLAGVGGHIEKTFVGFLPLVLLATIRALDPGRSRWWVLGPPGVLLCLAVYSGYQFMYGSIAVALFVVMAWLGRRGVRREVVVRAALVAGAALVLVGPALVAIGRASSSVGSTVDVAGSSGQYTPDVAQFFEPSYFQANYRFVDHQLPTLVDADSYYGVFIETSVTIGWVVLALAVVGAWKRWVAVRKWVVLTAVCIVFALGPFLRLFGKTEFTDLQLPLMLPYSALVSLPGFDFMRVSGRWMMMGAVGLAVLACYGLSWLAPRARRVPPNVVIGVVTALLLFEMWPSYWPQQSLPAASAFDRQLDAAGDDGAVLDLPVAWGPRSVTGNTAELMGAYQMLQLTHRRPIPYGYLSHTYRVNPEPVVELLGFGGLVAVDNRLVNPDLFLDGVPAPAVDPATRDQLLADGFEYVVWRKDMLDELDHHVADHLTAGFIASVFPPGTTPVYDDGSTVAYRLTPTTPAERRLAIAYGEGWGRPVAIGRPAAGTGTIDVTDANAGPATLRITTPPRSDDQTDSTVDVVVTDGRGESHRVELVSGATAEVPVTLLDGDQELTLTLVPSTDGRKSFRVRNVDLVTSAG
jgi:hypothetical protein